MHNEVLLFTQQLLPFSVPMHQLSQVQTKEAFYNNLDQNIQTTITSDKFIILGDFNARVETDSDNWNGILQDTGWENKTAMAGL